MTYNVQLSNIILSELCKRLYLADNLSFLAFI